MYLRHQPSANLLEVLDLEALISPLRDSVTGRFHSGEELQDPESFTKAELVFPSGEGLPRCWRDPRYRA